MWGSSKHTCVQTLIPLFVVEFPAANSGSSPFRRQIRRTDLPNSSTNQNRENTSPPRLHHHRPQPNPQEGWIEFFLIGKRVSWEGWKTCLGRWMLSIIGVRYLLTPHVGAETGDVSWREGVVETDADAMFFGCRIRLFRIYLVLYCILPRHTLRVRVCPQARRKVKRTREND